MIYKWSPFDCVSDMSGSSGRKAGGYVRSSDMAGARFVDKNEESAGVLHDDGSKMYNSHLKSQEEEKHVRRVRNWKKFLADVERAKRLKQQSAVREFHRRPENVAAYDQMWAEQPRLSEEERQQLEATHAADRVIYKTARKQAKKLKYVQDKANAELRRDRREHNILYGFRRTLADDRLLDYANTRYGTDYMNEKLKNMRQTLDDNSMETDQTDQISVMEQIRQMCGGTEMGDTEMGAAGGGDTHYEGMDLDFRSDGSDAEEEDIGNHDLHKPRESDKEIQDVFEKFKNAEIRKFRPSIHDDEDTTSGGGVVTEPAKAKTRFRDIKVTSLEEFQKLSNDIKSDYYRYRRELDIKKLEKKSSHRDDVEHRTSKRGKGFKTVNKDNEADSISEDGEDDTTIYDGPYTLWDGKKMSLSTFEIRRKLLDATKNMERFRNLKTHDSDHSVDADRGESAGDSGSDSVDCNYDIFFDSGSSHSFGYVSEGMDSSDSISMGAGSPGSGSSSFSGFSFDGYSSDNDDPDPSIK
jgi:hypothetical protein